MTLEDLLTKVGIYKEALDSIGKKRNHWQDFSKPLLKDTLQKITEKHPIGSRMYTIEFTKNSEAVNLDFGKM
jgi:hypothetical protein